MIINARGQQIWCELGALSQHGWIWGGFGVLRLAKTDPPFPNRWQQIYLADTCCGPSRFGEYPPGRPAAPRNARLVSAGYSSEADADDDNPHGSNSARASSHARS